MRYGFILLLAIVGLSFAAQRPVVEKVVVSDTIITIKVDTIKSIRYDTLKITKVYNDTALLVKQDTVKAQGKPSVIKKK